MLEIISGSLDGWHIPRARDQANTSRPVLPKLSKGPILQLLPHSPARVLHSYTFPHQVATGHANMSIWLINMKYAQALVITDA